MKKGYVIDYTTKTVTVTKKFMEEAGIIGTKAFEERKVLDEMGLVFQIREVKAHKSNKITYKQMMEYITRANYGLRIGNFEMDLRDGEIFYKTAGVFSDGIPVNEEIRRLVQVGIRMAEKYGQGFHDVMYLGKSPAETVAAIEANDD